MSSGSLRLVALTGIPAVQTGDDLPALIREAAESSGVPLANGSRTQLSSSTAGVCELRNGAGFFGCSHFFSCHTWARNLIVSGSLKMYKWEVEGNRPWQNLVRCGGCTFKNNKWG